MIFNNNMHIINPTVSQPRALMEEPIPTSAKRGKPNYACGLNGLEKLPDCSNDTACEMKRNGKIDKAISQVRRQIVIDKNVVQYILARKK